MWHGKPDFLKKKSGFLKCGTRGVLETHRYNNITFTRSRPNSSKGVLDVSVTVLLVRRGKKGRENQAGGGYQQHPPPPQHIIPSASFLSSNSQATTIPITTTTTAGIHGPTGIRLAQANKIGLSVVNGLPRRCAFWREGKE